jgi:hypothetical protein
MNTRCPPAWRARFTGADHHERRRRLFEMFMGDEGTIKMSENPVLTRFTAKTARRPGMI